MKIIRLLSPLLLVLLAATGYADTGFSIPHEFSVPASDKSLMLLGMLFGGMGDILPGAPNVVGPMFAKFNDAMLVLAGILVAYTGFFGVISMAHEGEFLGKKFNSIWTPIRTVAGMALLIPMKSGFCILQIILMWVVVQGVGAADTVWTTAVNYIEVHGVYNTDNNQNPNSKASAGSYAYILPQAGDTSKSMFTSFVCMYETYQHNGGSEKTLSPQITQIGTSKVGYAEINFPIYNADGSVTPGNRRLCGQLLIPDPQKTANGNSTTGASGADIAAQIAVAKGMPDILNVLSGAAKQYAFCKGGRSANCVDGTPISAASLFFADHITRATDEYMQQHNSGGSNDPTSNQARQLLTDSLKQGWIYAGAFYRELAAINPHTIQANVINKFEYSPPTASSQGQGFVDKDNTNFSQDVIEPLYQYPTNSLAQTVNVTPVSGFGNYGSDVASVFNACTKWIVTLFAQAIFGANNVNNQTFISNGEDPIVALQVAGEQIVNIIKTAWVVMFLVMALIVGLGWAVPSFNPVFGVAMIIMKVFTLLFLMLGMFFGAGLMMSVYIPMIPFIIFFFGVIGWLISVVETLLAAPMVALGIVYPDGGHELLGRASPAVMLMVNVFIRPTLMVFGLIIGMILSYVGVNFLNSAYSFVLWSNTSMNEQNVNVAVYGIGPFQWALYIILYVSLVSVLLNKAYSLIHKLPDQILRWIGGTHGFGEYSGGLEEVQGKAQGAAGQMQSAGNEGFQGSQDAMGKQGQQQYDKNKSQGAKGLPWDNKDMMGSGSAGGG